MQSKESVWVSPNSVAQRQLIAIDATDVRFSTLTAGDIVSSTGSQVLVVGGKGFGPGGVNLSSTGIVGGGNIGLDPVPSPKPDPYVNPYDPFLDPQAPSGRPKFFNLGTPTDLTATWVGDDLSLSFTYDMTVGNNSLTTDFIVHLKSSTATGSIERTTLAGLYKPTTSSTTQTILLTKAVNIQTLGFFCVDFASICVYASDSSGATGYEVCAVSIPTYVMNLPVPTITVTSVNNGYSVAWTDPASSQLTAIDIWEAEGATAPTITYAADGITPTNYNRVYEGKLNPAVIISPNINKRWVIARFSSTSSVFTAFTTPVSVSPTSPVTVNVAPPTDVTSITASWVNLNNIQINYTLPATNAGVRFVAILTAPNGATGYFYFFPDGTTNLNQTHIIEEADIKAQFGTYYSQFTGILKSASITDAQSPGTSFTVPLRANPLANVTPNPTILPVIDGYTVAFDTNTAAYGEVYEFYEDPSMFISTVHDYMDADWVSGGAPGSSSFVIQNFTDDMGMMMDGMPVMHIGYIITGTGIAPNTWVHSITGSGPYTITLKTGDGNGNIIDSPLTAQASGPYHMQALVYSGNGPYTAFSAFFQQRYVDVFYYDLFKQRSLPSRIVPITPINPAVQFIAPNPPTITVASTSYSSITLDIVTADQSTNQYLLFYKKDGDTSYNATLVNTDTNFTGPGNTSTSVVTIGNLLPNTLYDFYANGSSYVNGIGIASSTVQGTTTGATVSTVSNIVLNAITYGITANWTEASDTPTKIGKYKVDLYSGTNLLKTQYTYSTVTSFTGLTASTAYYVKIAAIDIYNEYGAAVTSSTLTLGAGGIATDGMPAPIANTPTITSLFNALEVTWTAISNPDPVTYEVHISALNGFTASSSTKYLETNGTFAIIKNLPDGTPLAYGTTYYVVLVARDPNGSAGQSGQASGSPSKIDNGDIATNAIRANVIQAGTITSNEINSSSLLVSKLFAVGNTTDSYAIKIDASGATTKLYSGAGVYSDAGTPFYLDTTGKFSLKDRLYFNGSNTLTVNGIIQAQSGYFGGAISVNGNGGTFKIGPAADGGSNNGIYINSSNYWYDTGKLSVGGTVGGAFNGVVWDGTSLKVTGQLNATSGTFSGTVNIATGGILTSGTYNNNGTLKTGYQLTPTGLLFNNNNAQTTYIDNTGFLSTNSANIGGWTVDSSKLQYLSGSNYTGFSTSGTYAIYAGAGSGGSNPNFGVTPSGNVTANYIEITGGKLDVGATSSNLTSGFHVTTSGTMYANGAVITGDITAISGRFTGNISINTTGSIYSGTLDNPTSPNANLTSAGFMLSAPSTGVPGGIIFRNAGGTATTKIDATTGTLTTNSASIGSWTINSSQIYKPVSYGSIYLDAGTTPAVYVGDTYNNFTAGLLSKKTSAVTDTAIWAGNVNPSNVTNASFKVSYDGTLNAKGANITGTITSTGNGTVTLDGPNDMIRISTASGSNAYMFPAATSGNFTGFYIAADSGSTSPFDKSGSVYTLNPTNMNAVPFFGIGSTKNAYGTSMDGIGLYAQNSYMNVTQSNGIGLWTGDGSTLKTGLVLSKSILSLGYNNNTNASPQHNGSSQLSSYVAPTSAGSNTINIDAYKILTTASNGVQLQVVGGGPNNTNDPSGAATGINLLSNYSSGPQITVNSGGIVLNSNVSRSNLTLSDSTSASVYSSYSLIKALPAGSGSVTIGSSASLRTISGGTQIYGIPIQGDVYLYNGYSHYLDYVQSSGNNMGPYPRQRMVVEDPISGMLVLGMGVYYGTTTQIPNGPSSGGYIGDLWVVYSG